MSDHATPIEERQCDVVIVGGSAAGLAAALQLVRQRRSVIVLDDGRPRNAPAAHLHGFLGRDGLAPAALIEAGRAEVRSYGGEILTVRATSVTRTDGGGFRVEIAGGHGIVARRVIAATGVVDLLPDVDGLAEQWGRGVIHCPFCHGYEVRDRHITAIITHPTGLHLAPLLRQLSDRVTLLLHDGVDVDGAQLDVLRAAGMQVRRGVARRIVTDGADSDGSDGSGGSDGRVTAVQLADGGRIDTDVVIVGPRFAARAEAFAPLGLVPSPHPSGLGDIVPTDPAGATAVPGLYAAGNLTDPGQQVLQAAADGSRVGAMVSVSLADEDISGAARPPSGNRADWEHRYAGEQVWSGNPNGTLVAEVTGLASGRALDVGAGEGGDALWLAERGWMVTASDISQRALDRVRAAAERRGLTVTCLRADANALGAFPEGAFDLVSASYASIPRTPDGRGLSAILGAVAPGGTLLVISHDLHGAGDPADPAHSADPAGPVVPADPADPPAHRSPFDPDAYLRVEDIAEALAGAAGWQIEVHQTRTRPAGAASGAQHVRDVVLRARRAAG